MYNLMGLKSHTVMTGWGVKHIFRWDLHYILPLSTISTIVLNRYGK